MNKIDKLASKFETLLKLASDEAHAKIQAVRAAAANLCSSVTKSHYLAAAQGDPYLEAEVEGALGKILSVSAMYVTQARTHGLTDSQHANFLSMLNSAVKDLEEVSGSLRSYVDPSVFPKLGALKSALGEVTPVAVQAKVSPSPATSAPKKPAPAGDSTHIEFPMDHIQSTPGGSVKTDKTNLPQEAKDVVQNLVDKNRPIYQDSRVNWKNQ